MPKKRAREEDGQFKGDDPSTPVVNEAFEPSNLLVTRIAKMCHAVNTAYQELLGEKTQPDWDDADPGIRSSAIAGVQYALANPNVKPEDSHKKWLKSKEAQGWKHGPVKDSVKKTHPCMVPYKELPSEQQTKDKLFLATVRSLS